MDTSNKSNIRTCITCKRTIPNTFLGELCPVCAENELFAAVRDYIRSNVVNEYMVAEHFSIPLVKVKEWIKEGRIEYSNDDNKRILVSNCQQCGKSISFGSICTDCLRSIKTITGVYVDKLNEDSKMRFLSDRNKD